MSSGPRPSAAGVFPNTLDKAEIAGHHVLEVISDEDPSDVQVDILSCLSVLVELFSGLAVGNEEEGLDGHLTIGDDVGLGLGSVLVLGDGLVELVVLTLLDIVSLPGPDGLVTLDLCRQTTGCCPSTSTPTIET
jgi:hypothetical protein